MIVLWVYACYHMGMDDTAQSPIQPNPQVVNAQGIPLVQSGQSVQDQSAPPVPQQQPVEPTQVSVPIGGKEHEGVQVVDAAPTHQEVEIPQEVIEAGVENAPAEEIQLNKEHKDAGIEPAKESTPVPSAPSMVQLPDEYKPPSGLGLLHQNVKRAATWLWLLLFKSQKQSERIAQTQPKQAENIQQ